MPALRGGQPPRPPLLRGLRRAVAVGLSRLRVRQRFRSKILRGLWHRAGCIIADTRISTASINAVPDGFTIFIDRRLTFGETKEEAVQQVKDLIPGYLGDQIKVEELFYDGPSYTGFVVPVDKYYPAWAIEEAHPIVQAGQDTIRELWNETRPAGQWSFSTNGTYWAGKAGIPSIGFGPGDEIYAHTVLDQVPLEEVVAATEFYALFPSMLGKQVK